ncbi:MAG: cobalamin biosynthesis protein, partial [Candidatus Omnitrophota bacterium]|nr:cobalamin biosynthesis protein [Candidatus Omnitrophota bacterium]
MTTQFAPIVYIIPAAYILDLLIGDPQTVWHPVRLIGRLIEVLEAGLNRPGHNKKFLGAAFVFLVSGATASGIWMILWLCAAMHSVLSYATSV